MEVYFGESYHEMFDPQAYLDFFKDVNTPFNSLFPLKHFHEFYSKYDQLLHSGLKILDYGTGPSIHYLISAAPHASEIVLSDYTEGNRTALQQWLENNPNAHDWSPYFKHVVETLEGKSEQEAMAREGQLRSAIKAILPCDANQDPVLQGGEQYQGYFDIISSSLCLENACATREDYAAAVKRLSSLLKPGGRLVMYSTERKPSSAPGFYEVGEHKFFNVRLQRKFITSSLEQAGFRDIAVVPLTGIKHPDPTFIAFLFVTATLNKEHKFES